MKKNVYPSKQTMNLVVYEKNMSSPSRAIPLFCLFLVALGFFVRFFVLMPLDEVQAAEASLHAVQVDLTGYYEYNQDYDAVEEEYNRYFSTYLTAEERGLADRISVLELLKTHIFGRADIESISFQNNTCRIVLTEAPLNRVTSLVAELEESPLIQYITVSTAVTEYQDTGRNRAKQPDGTQPVRAELTMILAGGTADAQ